jgi:hypothetical protein
MKACRSAGYHGLPTTRQGRVEHAGYKGDAYRYKRFLADEAGDTLKRIVGPLPPMGGCTPHALIGMGGLLPSVLLGLSRGLSGTFHCFVCLACHPIGGFVFACFHHGHILVVRYPDGQIMPRQP